MTHSLINKCAKNYYNRTFIVQVIAKNVVTCFFLRHSVVLLTDRRLCSSRKATGDALTAQLTKLRNKNIKTTDVHNPLTAVVHKLHLRFTPVVAVVVVVVLLMLLFQPPNVQITNVQNKLIDNSL